MRAPRLLGLLAAALCLAPGGLLALESGADFLDAQIPARPAAMAGAFAAYSDDPVAFLWNPAALGAAAEPMVSATHFLSIVDTEFDQASFIQPLRIGDSKAGMGMNVQYDTTTNFDQIDAAGNDLGAVENYDLLVGGSAGMSLGGTMRLGFTAKVFDSRLLTYEARGFAVDLGGQSDVTDRMTLAATLMNLGTQSAYDQVADPLPTNFDLAGRYLIFDADEEMIQMGAQLDRPFSTDLPITLGVGGEYSYRRTLVFRAGWLFGTQLGPFSLGVGFKWHGFSVDYAYNSLGDLGMTNRFSVSVELGTLFQRLGWTVDPIQNGRPSGEEAPVHVTAPAWEPGTPHVTAP